MIHCGVHLGSCGEFNTHAGRDGICHMASASSTVSASESFAIRPPPSLQPYTGGASRLLYLENMASVSRRQGQDKRSAPPKREVSGLNRKLGLPGSMCGHSQAPASCTAIAQPPASAAGSVRAAAMISPRKQSGPTWLGLGLSLELE